MIFVQPAGLRGPALQNWVTAADHARSLPPKPPKRATRQAANRTGETKTAARRSQPDHGLGW